MPGSLDSNETESSGQGTADSYFQSSDSSSQDSATIRRHTAQERLQNLEEASSGPAMLALPLPLPQLGAAQAPGFLKPEATKQVARPIHRSHLPKKSAVVAELEPIRKEWDIADMAPQLKKTAQDGPSSIISAAAKRNAPEADPASSISAAQVAMLGGQLREKTPGRGSGGDQANKKQKSMNVSEFLAQGEGGGKLPRKLQHRKDQEKEKRSKGQSSVHGWKSEAEMVLRQQYDS